MADETKDHQAWLTKADEPGAADLDGHLDLVQD